MSYPFLSAFCFFLFFSSAVDESEEKHRRTSTTKSPLLGTAAHPLTIVSRKTSVAGPPNNQTSKVPSLVNNETWLALREAAKAATLAIENNIHQQHRQQQSACSSEPAGTIKNFVTVSSVSSASGVMTTSATASSSKEMPQRGIQKLIPSSYQVACMAAGISSVEHHQDYPAIGQLQLKTVF
ncbi:unnamed protein product [Dibothriocephalus latus]|uniref:Uncharacterized protein n=1 Tax=Dibothriocephalus latus TaxID=60516 RepID=A0A3P7M3C3_DIBLA|nr:unnamed protein product [Dibothriocephalus latus]